MKKTFAIINSTPVLVEEAPDGLYVPVRPICDMLGIASHGQRERIQRDPILGPVGRTIRSTGADGKTYEMLCLPFRYIFGWLFTITASMVKEEARGKLIQYQKECYDALYDYFENKYKKHICLLQAENEARQELEAATGRQETAKKECAAAKKRIKEIQDERLHIEEPTLFD